ncbi:hypothetical protein LMG28614_04624 [Paraburkholderia ultramafica]|uniref:Cell wall surface anchor family protein n=1 Tax=Paraburkholderia ultramafica TaxID=1544867 RepID=A0A6S7BS59_9BURK|nr:hypothetical protein [Paraburkholderia ultramafica]CAB3797698.1 hypothetical protein LMG28614_04624 [Paraburkholderia ultramafica]
MADSVASRQSRPQRAASKKRRQATVSTETENKLARAARSAQRLAQLSGAPRDDSTLDLFPDDPTRATLEAMNIDIRQGTLDGFELPDVVLAAVGAIDAGDGMAADAKAARRAPRTARADEPAPVSAQLSGLEIEPLTPMASPVAEERALADAKPAAEVAADGKPTASVRDSAAPLTPAMAAASVARSVTALRQAAEPGAATTDSAVASNSGGKPPQRFAATFAKAATASRDAAAAEVEVVSKRADGALEEAGAAPAESAESARSAGLKPGAQPLANASASAEANAAFAAPWREAQRAEAAAAAAALRVAPELDRARATAFADTVDALYGVIADQRRAATDHSRRMKWMLSIVVGALLVTVAIGITQTLLLMRLTRETTAQQHRIEQMMQSQQAAMASLLDTHIAMANAAAANAASATAATVPAAAQQAAATLAHGRRAARALHGHRVKTVNPD